MMTTAPFVGASGRRPRMTNCTNRVSCEPRQRASSSGEEQRPYKPQVEGSSPSWPTITDDNYPKEAPPED